MAPSWLVTAEKVQRAIKKIVEVSRPRKLILFGSYVRGDMNQHSDLDVLVVAGNNIASPRQESVRIRQFLRGISMPMDILVISESRYKELAAVPGLIFNEIHEHGKVVYQAA